MSQVIDIRGKSGFRLSEDVSQLPLDVFVADGCLGKQSVDFTWKPLQWFWYIRFSTVVPMVLGDTSLDSRMSVCGLKPATFSRVRIGQGFEAGGLFAAVFCGFCVAGRFAGLAGFG